MAGKQEWLVILPDYSGALDKRMEIRPTHLANAKTSVAAGQLVMGGAILDEPVVEGKPLNITGSAMMFCADTREEVLEQVKQDVYYKGDVWDKDKILPFKTAFRQQL
ncbi:hypothetical protein AMS68_002911 [Peltaster fructicola]|uniref:YCII-related domain-containing protein n=1 Tax=Peltaster fructicola TaxID=286661 RepID=A0A6H0XRN6_9PEZI|nr:hypothetical protein AMS68_002911 [Peltaster fructicola]